MTGRPTNRPYIVKTKKTQFFRTTPYLDVREPGDEHHPPLVGRHALQELATLEHKKKHFIEKISLRTLNNHQNI